MADEHKEHAEHGEGGGGHGGGHKGGHGGGHGGGGGHEEHEGAPEWLISFADNVALMMGFFVILLAMNMQKPSTGGIGGEGKYPSEVSPQMEDVALSIRTAFNMPVDINSTNPNEQALVRRLKEKAAEGGRTKRPGPNGADETSAGIRTSDWYRLFGRAYFNDFETVLNDEGRKSLEEMAERLKGQRWMIEVRGHASVAESNGNPDRAMRLSYDRAAAVAAQLVKEGLSRDQMRVVACGDHERSTPRAATREGHRDNQRVEIITTLEEAPDDPYRARPVQRDDDAEPRSRS